MPISSARCQVSSVLINKFSNQFDWLVQASDQLIVYRKLQKTTNSIEYFLNSIEMPPQAFYELFYTNSIEYFLNSIELSLQKLYRIF